MPSSKTIHLHDITLTSHNAARADSRYVALIHNLVIAASYASQRSTGQVMGCSTRPCHDHEGRIRMRIRDASVACHTYYPVRQALSAAAPSQTRTRQPPPRRFAQDGSVLMTDDERRCRHRMQICTGVTYVWVLQWLEGGPEWAVASGLGCRRRYSCL
ncbi:hypothetical protein BC826DRAFT_1060722 [Russula brevipes]|nr:hypothetical protein BC826DRAFT_1060722 [Russula brevipes]